MSPVSHQWKLKKINNIYKYGAAGVSCYVTGCTNTSTQLKRWEKERCDSHKVFHFSNYCNCPPPFQFFAFPTESQSPGVRPQWLAACQTSEKTTKEIQKSHRVCSKHFIDGKPTDAHPLPELYIGSSVRGSVQPSVNATTDRQAADVPEIIQGFDPDRSQREMRKIYSRISQKKKKNLVYDGQGIHVDSGLDLCDCLEPDCPGCHNPCSKCSSRKCGTECRNHRLWVYQQVEIEGTNKVIEWPGGLDM